MLSKKCKYAIRSVLYLADNNRQKKMNSGVEIANQLGMPTAFTVKILQELAREKFILSVKGPNGGFYIDDTIRDVKIIDIITAIDGNAIFYQCGIGLKECSEEHPCPFHDTFKMIRDELYNAFSSKSIGDFCVDHTLEKYYLSDVGNSRGK
jgi:Rrf2 family protein